MQIKPFSYDSKNAAGFALIEVDFKTYTVNTIVALDILNDINKTSIGDRFH